MKAESFPPLSGDSTEELHALRQKTGAAQRHLGRTVALIMVLGFFYNAYRYPLQINSTDTSPTYSDTPIWLSLGKYVLFAMLLMYGAVGRLAVRTPLRVRHAILVVVYGYLSLYPMVAGSLVLKDKLVTTGIFFLIPLVLLIFYGCIYPYREVNRLLTVAVVIGLISNALQVALFLTVGRLPALAYSDSIMVRFGSFLDDPNGFGVLIAWMLPFAWFHFRPVAAAGATIFLFASLVLTQSLTALITTSAVIVVFLMIGMLSRVQSFFRALIALLVTASVGVATYYWLRAPIADAYALFMLTKRGSIEGHADALDVVREVGLLNVVGWEPFQGSWTESGYINIVGNFGLLYLLVYLAVGVVAMWRYFTIFRRASGEVRAFAAGGLGLLIATYVGNVNLPLVEVFPVNLFSALILGLASAGFVVPHRELKARARGQQSEVEEPGELVVAGPVS